MLHRTGLAAVLVLIAGSLSLAQQPEQAGQPGGKIKLRVAFPTGTYTMTMTSEGETTVKFGQQEMKTKSSESAVWELLVGEPNDKGDKKVTLKLVRIKTTEAGEKTASFDSEKPGEGDAAMAFIYKPLLGLPVQVTLDSDDAVVEVSGLDKLWNELTEKAKADEEKSALVEVRMSLGDKALEQSLRRLECVMPKNAVSVNDTWKGSMRVDLPVIGEIKARYDCKLASVDAAPGGQVATVASEGKYENTNPKPTKINGVDVTIVKMDVTEKSTLRVDVKTGVVQADQRALDVNAELKAKGEDGADVNATIKGTTNSKVTIEPKKAGGPIVIPGVDDTPAPKGKLPTTAP